MWNRWSRKLSVIVTPEKDKSKDHNVSLPPQQPATSQNTEIRLSFGTDAARVITQSASAILNSGEPTVEKSPDPVKQAEAASPVNESATLSDEVANGLSSTTPVLLDVSHAQFPSAPSPIPQSPTDQTGSITRSNIAGLNQADEQEVAIDGVMLIDTLSAPDADLQPGRIRRVSFRSLAFFYGHDKQPHSSSFNSPTLISQTKGLDNSNLPASSDVKVPRSQREALSAAVTLRTLIIGPSSLSSPTSRHIKSRVPGIKKVKAQLLKPKSANAIISQLRRLPLPDGPPLRIPGHPSSESLVIHPDAGGTPIHAVCLACTDEEAEKVHFSRLRTVNNLSSSSLPPVVLSAASSPLKPSVGTATLESLIPVFKDLRVISLLASPDLGFGQPVSDDDDLGVLTGSVPSAGAIVGGLEEITKQLMALGFATSKAVFPSHAGIYPPVDRMTILTYWWGLELVLPEPSITYLGKAKSISSTLINFLSALALFNNGVREVLPFIRYVANFVDFEWAAIKAQDKGRGVVCAATWIMPAAMVPRSWDFPTRSETIPVEPATPATQKPNPSGDNQATEGTVAPVGPPVKEPDPATSPDMLYPGAPFIPMMPQLMVTPATLPRHSSALQEAAA